jgi:hypothetical protein
MDVKKILRVGVDWIHLGQDRKMAGCSEHSRHLGIIKCWEFPDWVKDN